MAYNELYILGGIDTDDATATASQILSGYTAYVKGKKISGNIQSQGAQTITPGTSDKTIASGKYLSGTQTIKGDANLTAGNIKKGISIFGVSGTYTSDANATAANILSGKTAYVNGSKITGSMLDRTTVGKNGGIGINESFSTIPLFVGESPQTGKALDGNTYAAIGVPEGFYTGGGWGYVGVNVNNVNLKAENIKSGVNVFGVLGSYTGTIKTYTIDVTSSSGSLSFITDGGVSKNFPYIKLTNTSDVIPHSISCQQSDSGGLQCASDIWNYVINTTNISFFAKRTNGNMHWAKNDIQIPVLNSNTRYRVAIIGL